MLHEKIVRRKKSKKDERVYIKILQGDDYRGIHWYVLMKGSHLINRDQFLMPMISLYKKTH
jgi:hypothetical protein